jgi:signal transduction histidine kinase
MEWRSKPHIYLLKSILIFGLYFVSGYGGLKADSINNIATLFWAPAGLALSVFLLWGFEYWPCIFLGALCIELMSAYTLPFAIITSTGCVLETFIGTKLLKYKNHFEFSLSRIRDVLTLFSVAMICTIPSATIGALTLWLRKPQNFGGFAVTWNTWWFGDTLGILIITPLILVWSKQSKPRFNPLKFLELVLLVIFLISINLMTFTSVGGDLGLSIFALPYIFFPGIIWTAFRFGQWGTVTGIFFITAFAMAGTALRIGPFGHTTATGNLFLLDSFITIISATGLMLAAAVMERRKAITDLRTTENQLKDAIRYRDDFLSIASHELKTPITSLSLQLQLTERSIDAERNTAPSPKKLAQVLDLSRKQINRLTFLIEDLFDVSRIQTGKLNFIFEKIHLSILVRDMVDRYVEQLKKTQTSLEIDIEEDIYIKGDYPRLEQVMDNLISNAIKYAPGSPLTIQLRSEAEKAILVVKDSGLGIAKDKQEKIFDRYERATESKNISGLGLGLFIVREIVKAHSGIVLLESDKGQGAKFIIEFPKIPT